MNRNTKGQTPNQGSYSGYPQTGYYPPQSTGQQDPGTSYFPQGGNYSQPVAGYGTQPQNGYVQGQGTGYMQQNAFPQSQMNGYPAQGTYARQGQTGGFYPQNGYGQAPAVNGYPPVQGAGYAQQGGWSQGQAYAGGYSQPGTAAGGYPQAQGYPAGGYPQQGAAPSAGTTPYTQQPYGTGYQPQGYTASQGYSPFQQMGRNPGSGQTQNGGAQQIPLNGAGYVPQPVPVRRAPFQLNDTWLILISVVLLILFAAGMFAPGLSMLKWVFLVLGAGSAALLWIKPVVAGNKRICFTAVVGILALVTAVSLATAGNGSRQGGNGQTASPASQQTTASPGSGSDLSGGSVVDGQSGQTISSISAPVPEETPAPKEDNSAVERLETFFYYWNANQIDEMLTLCSPSWQSNLESPKTSLFALMANRTPKEMTLENITGTSEDLSRTVTIAVVMDRNNGNDPVKYRMNVVMVREGDIWYVDPQSLKSYDQMETEDPNVSVSPTPSPTPSVDAGTVLYYNPDGGSKYHLDPNCKSTHQKFLPFKGHFTYSQVNDPEYASLTPCNVCGAPLREQ